MFSKFKHTHWLIVFFVSYFSIWFVVSLFNNIHPDSLDHWGWSQHLALGYISNPPMIVYWMKVMSFFVSNEILAIKLGGVLSSMLVLFSAYLAAREFVSKQAALVYLLILHSTFYYSLFSQFWTIEQPYNFFWFLSLWTVGKYFNTQNKKWLLLLGLFIGMGAMSKYIIVLFCIILFFWLLWDKKHRPLLWSPYLWVSGIIAIFSFGTVLYWNLQRDWVSFRFVLDKGFEQKWNWSNLLQLQLSHLLFYSLFLSLPVWYFLLSRRFKNLFETSKFRFLFIHSFVPILFFSYSSLQGKLADPNWLSGSYIALYIFLAAYFYYLLQKSKKFFPIVCISLSHIVVFSLIIFFLLFQKHQFSFVSENLAKRFNDANGWREIAEQTESLLQEKEKSLPDYIITKHYQTGGALAFYLSGYPDYYVTQREERELVSKEKITQSRALVFIRDYALDDVGKIKKIFPQKWEHLGDIEAVINGKKIRKFQVWLKQAAL